VVGHVGEEQARVADRPQHGQPRQHRVGGKIEGEQPGRQDAKLEIPRRDRDDPDGHHEREIGGREMFHGTRTGRWP
jgi:hypothetical protein